MSTASLRQLLQPDFRLYVNHWHALPGWSHRPRMRRLCTLHDDRTGPLVAMFSHTLQHIALDDQRGRRGWRGLTAISKVQPALGCVQIVAYCGVLEFSGDRDDYTFSNQGDYSWKIGTAGEDGQAWLGSP